MNAALLRVRATLEERESAHTRLRRYEHSGLCEVSDPEYWQELHHGESESDPEDDVEVETPSDPVTSDPFTLTPRDRWLHFVLQKIPFLALSVALWPLQSPSSMMRMRGICSVFVHLPAES